MLITSDLTFKAWYEFEMLSMPFLDEKLMKDNFIIVKILSTIGKTLGYSCVFQ